MTPEYSKLYDEVGCCNRSGHLELILELRRQVETLTKDRDEANRYWNGSLEAQGELEAQVERLTEALTAIVVSGVRDIDSRLVYIEVQIDRDDWAQAKQALNPDGKESRR